MKGVAHVPCGPDQGRPGAALRGPHAAPRVLHGARTQQRGRDGAGAGRSRGPAHHPTLPALRALGLGAGDGDVREVVREHSAVTSRWLGNGRGNDCWAKEKKPGVRAPGVVFFFLFSRGGQIRTADLSDPNRARYQTALRPETEAGLLLAVGVASWPCVLAFLRKAARAGTLNAGRGASMTSRRARRRVQRPERSLNLSNASTARARCRFESCREGARAAPAPSCSSQRGGGLSRRLRLGLA